MDKPKIRPVEAIPIPEEDPPLFQVHDPEQYCQQVLTVTYPTLAVLQQMNGQQTRAEIQSSFQQIFKQELPGPELDQLIDSLDQMLLLESEQFIKARQERLDQFAAAQVRAPICAGGDYPDSKEELLKHLENIFTAPGRPGLPDASAAKDDLVGLISPHIDTTRGQAGYATAYKELAEHTQADTFILLGTNHQSFQSQFIATKKPYQTPLGNAAVDHELLDALSASYDGDLFADEYSHRSEHSLEFQVLLLQFVLAGRPDFRILPILCNSPFLLTRGDKSPALIAPITSFARSLKEAVKSLDRKVVYIAGADLAHIGPQFGDEQPVDEDLGAQCKNRDLEMLQFALRQDPEGFYNFIQAEQDQRRICGLGPIDTLLRCLDDASGKLLKYDQWIDENGNGSVSFASIGYYRQERESD